MEKGERKMKRNEKQNCKHIKRIHEENGISASSVILEDYAEQLVKHGVQPVIQCEKCKYWKKYGYDPIIEKCWGECCRPFGEDGVTQETAENDFCSFAKEATYESLYK